PIARTTTSSASVTPRRGGSPRPGGTRVSGERAVSVVTAVTPPPPLPAARSQPRPRGSSRCHLPRLRLGRVGETMFPPRTPFFRSVRLDARADEIAANVEEFERGNLTVYPSPFQEAAHAATTSQAPTISSPTSSTA